MKCEDDEIGSYNNVVDEGGGNGSDRDHDIGPYKLSSLVRM